jgi:hypothetical protein
MEAVRVLRPILTPTRDWLAQDGQDQLSMCCSGQIRGEYLYISVPSLEALGVDTTGETDGKRREPTPMIWIRRVLQHTYRYCARKGRWRDRTWSFRPVQYIWTDIWRLCLGSRCCVNQLLNPSILYHYLGLLNCDPRD